MSPSFDEALYIWDVIMAPAVPGSTRSPTVPRRNPRGENLPPRYPPRETPGKEDSMQCPQCNTTLGEGAKACATCGWSGSRKTLWIVLGCIAGFLFLVCCGIGTWLFMKGKQFVSGVQEEIVPLTMTLHHAQVANYAQKRGKAPATLQEAMTETLVIRNGESIKVQTEKNGSAMDAYGRPIRFTMNADRTFEIRSAGKDGAMDTPDDVAEKGTLDDDVPTLVKRVEDQFRDFQVKMQEKAIRTFGGDPSKLPPPAPEEPEEPEDAPAVGTQGGGGK
jgi:hypothetical protein